MAEARKTKVAESGDVKAPMKAPETIDAAPLDAPPPKMVPRPATPLMVRANAVTPHVPYNHNGVRLLDEASNEISVADIFDHPGPEDPGIMVTVNQRVFREFIHPNTVTPVTQLIYPQGALITKAEARRLKDEMTPPAEQADAAG